MLFVFMYVNDIDTDTSNTTGIKLTIFAYETGTLITGKYTLDLIFNLDRINGDILPWFDMFCMLLFSYVN